MAMKLIDEAMEAGARQAKACQIIGIDPRTLRRWKTRQDTEDKRKMAAAQRTPANKLSEAERAHIIRTCNLPKYKSLPPSQIVSMLADEGTYLASALRGGFYYLYLIEDVFSRKIVGWEIHERESATHASELIRNTCLAESIHEDGLVLHSDNGSPMKGATMLATLQKLGVVPSFSRPSVSDDNPYSESLFRTMKYAPSFPNQPFQTLEAAREWVHEFVQWYNQHHRHSAIRYVTPNQRHDGKEHTIMKQRKKVYAAARARNPSRWSGATRNWDRIDNVWLNPPKEVRAEEQQQDRAA